MDQISEKWSEFAPTFAKKFVILALAIGNFQFKVGALYRIWSKR